MFKKILFIFLYLFSIAFISLDISYESFNIKKNIYVEVKGEVKEEKAYNLTIGDTFEDLLQLIDLTNDSDISSFSLKSHLYNNQIINIPKKKNYSLISINNSNVYELSSLPGIGKSIALKIIEYRTLIGNFQSIEELKDIDGIGEKKFNKIRSFICL